MSTGTWFSHPKSQSCFLRIVCSRKMNGVQLEFSRVVGGCTMLFIVPNRISCYSGGP